MQLAKLLADARPEQSSIMLAANRLNVSAGRLAGVDAIEKWQSLIELVDDSTQHSLDTLLDDAVDMLGPGRTSNSIIAWRERAAPTASLVEAVSEAGRLLSEITSYADPRRGGDQLRGLVSALREIVDRLSHPENFDTDIRTDAPQLQASARRAMRTARRLSLSVGFAESSSRR